MTVAGATPVGSPWPRAPAGCQGIRLPRYISASGSSRFRPGESDGSSYGADPVRELAWCLLSDQRSAWAPKQRLLRTRPSARSTNSQIGSSRFDWSTSSLAKGHSSKRAARPPSRGWQSSNNRAPSMLRACFRTNSPICASRSTAPGTNDGLPADWAGMLDASELADGVLLHFDFGTVLPPLDGVVLRLDTLVSGPEAWQVYLRGVPRSWSYSEDGRNKRSLLAIRAEDDLGASYLSTFAGSTGHAGYEDLALKFRPRLDPLARALQLTVTGVSDQFVLDLELVPPDRNLN